MIKISTKMLATTTLILSTMMIISSENWFGMWMGLEINMVSFIPLMMSKKSYNSSEAKMIYFLIQSMSSITFLFTIIMTPTLMINENNIKSIPLIMMNLAMLMKMGMAPMHMWFINIIKKMNWKSCMMLMTWQKVGPMMILSNMMQENMMTTVFGVTSAVIGAIGGINQTSMQKIMAFSSINHLGWMIFILKNENETWIKYLIIYSIMIYMITSMFEKNSIYYLNQMNMNNKNYMEKINIMIMFLSLGGLPPFLGFLPKWMAIQSMIINESKLTIMIMMFMSMITLFYYMRMISPTIMSFNLMNKWNYKNNNMKNINMFKIMINMSLPVMMMINMI